MAQGSVYTMIISMVGLRDLLARFLRLRVRPGFAKNHEQWRDSDANTTHLSIVCS